MSTPESALASPAVRSQDLPARHALTVRATHWIAAACFFALLVSGIEILISHPRFYWGNEGNDLTKPLFVFHIPASRSHVPTGYKYTLPDQNGWSRSLHFQSAWALLLTGFAYLVFGLYAAHFRRNLLPRKSELNFSAMWNVVLHDLGLRRSPKLEGDSYNVLQRLTYLFVLFVLFPLVIWTGLAMSPAFVSAWPLTESLLGGRQSARTLHFFVTVALVVFFLVHVVMVWRAGFWSRVRAMITGRSQ